MIRLEVSHVIELTAKTPAEGLLPISHSGVDLREIDLGRVTSVAPFAGQSAEVEALLGAGLPKIGRSTSKAGQEVVWFSQGQYLIIGQSVDETLAKHAALTDQSDAWCAVELSGAGSEDVLARLIPIDLRAKTFKRGQVARSQLGHLPLHVTRTGKDGFRLISFRSMAGTIVHELSRAMVLFAGRG